MNAILNEYKEIILERARELGLSEYEIYYMRGDSTSVETLEHEVNAFSSSTGGGISFRCIRNGKMGYASTELFERDELRGLVDRASENALFIESEDKCFIFGGSESYADVGENKIDTPDASLMRESALGLQERTYAESELVSYGTQSNTVAFSTEICLANSHGLELYNKIGLSAAVVSAVLKMGEEASDAYEYACGSTMEELGDLPKRVVDEAMSKFGAKGVKTGNYNVVFSGKMARSLLSTFSSVFSAKNAQMGLSLLAGKEGEVIAAECITICDDPAHDGFSNKTAFDGEGVATYKKNVVEKGVLKTLLYDLTTAEKAGKTSTGNGQRGSYTSSVSIAPYCFSIEGGDISEEMLLSLAGDGIYVTELKGLHAGADAVTGDFSVESAGYLIENGKLGGAIKSFTVSGNFFELIKNVSALSDKVDFGLPSSYKVFGAPSMLIKGLSVAGE